MYAYIFTLEVKKETVHAELWKKCVATVHFLQQKNVYLFDIDRMLNKCIIK